MQMMMNASMGVTHVHLMLLALTQREVIIAIATLDIQEMVKTAEVRNCFEVNMLHQ